FLEPARETLDLHTGTPGRRYYPRPEHRQREHAHAEPDGHRVARPNQLHRATGEQNQIDADGDGDDYSEIAGFHSVRHKSNTCSRPTVSPGRVSTERTPKRTPGMNDVRSSESCRMVNVSPGAPNRISSCATRPGNRTEWTRTPSTSAPRAPSSSAVVASSPGPLPASARASEINRAVCAAVPDGASTLRL